LKRGQLQPILDEAIARWDDEGGNTERLANIKVRIANLPGRTLAKVRGNTIWIDSKAAGWGWFVDPTPSDDSEFTMPGDQGEQNRMDLLSVLMHEVGHMLGHEHDAEGIMVNVLAAGSRLSMDIAFDGISQFMGMPESTKARRGGA
jgi:hypothetical protein